MQANVSVNMVHITNAILMLFERCSTSAALVECDTMNTPVHDTQCCLNAGLTSQTVDPTSILTLVTNPERLIRTRSDQSKLEPDWPNHKTCLYDGLVIWISNRFAKPCVSLAQTFFRFGCKFGSGIGIPNRMVYFAQTVSRLAANVLLSIHGVRFGHTNRSKPDH